MFKKTSLMVAAAVAAAISAAPIAMSGGAVAAPLAGWKTLQIEPNNTIEQVHSQRRRGYRRYDRRRHGERQRRRHGRYRHERDGWYYSVPWWLGFSLTLPHVNRYHYDRSAHVEWCDRKYRSYNRRTDQFLGYDGRYHYCNSPYDRR